MPSMKGTTSEVAPAEWKKPRPESGIEWLKCSKLARQRFGSDALGRAGRAEGIRQGTGACVGEYLSLGRLLWR